MLVLPGFTATDRSTHTAAVVPARPGLLGARLEAGRTWTRPGVVDGLTVRLAAVHERHERPVTVIGWSLGGIYARQIARTARLVRQVITLGTPFRIVDGDHSAAA